MTTDERARSGYATGPLPDRLTVDGVEIAYEIRGTGDPVVLIHAGVCADWFVPLMREPALDGCRVLRYHRAGYGDSGRVAGPLGVDQQAAHCAELMRQLGMGGALVVGHSSSANIALQLALSAPDLVGSLALLETALLTVPSGAYAADAFGRYRAGDRAGAVDTWMRGVCGPDYRAALDRAVPGAFDQAVSDVDTFFGQELPALRAWQFTAADAARVSQPVLAVLGADSDEVSPVFRERHQLLLAWLPDVEPFVLPGANHLLHVQNPGGMTARLAGFARRARPSG